MANIGVVPTGNKWPGSLECSRLDAYAGAFKLDPSLPVLGTDPKYLANKVVIGRGRLVGIKADATGHASAITTTFPHQSILTVADGNTVAPLGYATSNIIKDWDSKTNGVMAPINRNMAIAVPYLAALNGLYGTLKQGMKVTALASNDPRKKGAICKYIPYGVSFSNGAAGSILLSGGFTNAPLASVQTAFAPKILAAYTVAGALVTGTAMATTGYGSTGFYASGATVTSVIVGYGQTPDMIAGEVIEMEGLTDVPGFLQWVTSNFGEWSLGYDLAYPLVGNSTATTATTGYYLGTGTIALNKTGTSTLVPTRIDASQPITITTSAATSAFIFNTSTGVWDDMGVSYTLPRATFEGADYTQGANYSVDPINGVIRFFGVASDANGAQFGAAATAGDAVSSFSIAYSAIPMQSIPDYDTGVYGLTDPSYPSAPQDWTKDVLTNAVSVGIMKVAIH